MPSCARVRLAAQKPFLLAISILAVPLVAAAAPARSASVTIDGSVTLVESPRESEPVRRAAEDLRNDFAKVFGSEPRLVHRLEDAGTEPAILIAQRENLPPGVSCATTANTEAFAFSIVRSKQHGAPRPIVCLAGADMRGTIYAIYEFSERILGVDPMYLWTDDQPVRRASITLPADFARLYPSPVFRYRGFFINDEDLLTGWHPAPPGAHTGISLKSWDMVFETILRLKGNMVVPGTWIFPDNAQVHAAAERGLIVNQHHATPLGMNVARWPQGVPYNFSTHPEILECAWTNAVAEYNPHDEILWSVGLRGLSDQSYARLDPSVRGNDKLLGERISQAIADQMKIVRARYPHAQFIANLWQEGDRLRREGDLKVPPEVTLVWADTGYGDMQDHGEVAAGQGMYFHVAMMNGRANQLTEMVSAKTIQSEIGRYIKAGATGYLLLNTSDLRPVAMGARAVMEMAWAGNLTGVADTTGGAALSSSDPDGAYYRRWATEEFGAKSAPALEKIYKAYFAAPAPRRPFGPPRLTPAGTLAPPPPPLPVNADAPIVDGDQFYHTEARRLILEYLSQGQVASIPSQSPKWEQPHLVPTPSAQVRKALLNADISACAAAQPRWDAVWREAMAAQPLVDPARRDYYQAQVLTMIQINRESNRMLLALARSLKDEQAGRADKAQNEAAAALLALDAVRASMSAAEYGKWKNWYRGDWLTGVYRTRQLVQDYANHLKDPLAKLPAPVEWNGWEAYFHIMEYEDNRSVDVR